MCFFACQPVANFKSQLLMNEVQGENAAVKIFSVAKLELIIKKYSYFKLWKIRN
jgi:hypothetical protein